VSFPREFLKDAPTKAPQHPVPSGAENAPLLIKRDVVPFEDLVTPPQGSTAPSSSNLPGFGSSDQTRSTGRP
jgi:hypothetical protein